MQRSNTYIIVFSAVMTIILGGLLSFTSQVLKPLQDRQVDLDNKKKILGAVMDISKIKEPEAILELYKTRFTSIVVDINGEIVEKDKKGNPVVPEKVNIQKNSKLPREERLYPVFRFINEADQSKVDAYIFPMWGKGLWDWISGFVAISSDMNTVQGIAFDHKQETPGLGARITTDVVKNRYVGKKIFNTNDKLVGVSMVKGEKGEALDDHHVDGMSGATLTGNGVNAMLLNYLECYQSYIEKVKTSSSGLAQTELNNE